MKPTKYLLCTSVVASLAFAASNASAIIGPGGIQSSFPAVRLNISGTVVYNDYTVDTNDNTRNYNVSTNGNTIKGTLHKFHINNKTIIQMLNASTNVTTTLTDLGLPDQIPAGSYFVWSLNPANDVDDTNANLGFYDDVIVTNKNGFSFRLTGIDPAITNGYDVYSYGSVTVDELELVGNFKKNAKTSAGTESDLTGVEIYFGDDNNYFDSYGNASLKWRYSAANKDNIGIQKTALSVKFFASNGYAGSVDRNDAMTLSNFKAVGRARGTDPVYQNPFYIWRNNYLNSQP